jgi:hypothetical protein
MNDGEDPRTSDPETGSPSLPSPEPLPSDSGAPAANLGTRFIQILFAPRQAFTSIASHPRTWWQPLIVLIALAAITLYLTYDPLYLPKTVEALRDAGQSEEEIARTLPIVRMVSWGALIMIPVVSVLIALILHFVCGTALGGAGRFVQSLAVIAHASLVGVVESLVKVPLMLAKGEPEVFFGPAALLPADMATGFAFRFVGQLDLFALWKVALFALGLAIVHRLRFGRTLATVGALWLVWAMVGAALGGLGAGGP